MTPTGDQAMNNKPNTGRVAEATRLSQVEPEVSPASGFDPSRVVPWPDNNVPLDFEQISRPILHAIRFAYDLKRRDRRRSIPWRGPEIAPRDQACCPKITERLKANHLSYAEEDQGRDALEEIVAAAIQLGIEQGRRLARSDACELLDGFSGAAFTVSVGWDDWTHVHTKAGLRSDPQECLRKAIQALQAEAERVARCPREKFLRDSDRNRDGEDAQRLSAQHESAVAKPIAQGLEP